MNRLIRPGNFCLLLIGFLYFNAVTAIAQNTTIEGKVTDADGEPLTGATVSIQELPGIGSAVDMNGEYIIVVPDNRVQGQEVTLVVRFISYRTQQVKIILDQGTIEQDFILRDDLLQLDEVVVTGQGSVTDRRKLSSPIETINVKQIEASSATSVDQLLQGKLAGGSIRMQSAQPGQAGLINLRGITSAFGSQTPVIYIDGIRVDNSLNTSPSGGGESTSAISDLLISDIERIEVTKGGAASTLFGSDASNGVIQIFTKRGATGKPRITIRTEQGFDQPVTRFLNDTGFSFPGINPDSESANPDNVDFGQTSFIKDELLQTGYFQNYQASVSGGNQGVRYSLSGRIQDGEGVQINNENTLYTLRGSFTFDLDDNLTLDFSGAYTRNSFERIFNGEAIADPLTAFEVGDALFFTGGSNFQEALDIFSDGSFQEDVNRFILSSSVGYNPFPSFSNKFTIGLDYRTNSQKNRNSSFSDGLFGTENGFIGSFDREAISVTLEYVGTYNYTINPDLSSTTTFGVQGFRTDISTISGSGENFALPGADDFGNAAQILADESEVGVFNGGVFVQQQLDIWDKLFLNGGIRLDGNSAFGDEIGLVAFPKVGAAYEISAEDFWDESFGRTWSQMKLRASYGETGQFPEEFRKDLTFSSISFRNESAPRFSNPGNLDLTVERTKTIEAGFDSGFFDDRLGINFTYFNSTTEDAFFFVPEPVSSGRISQLRNVGEIENEGIEISAVARIIQSRNVNWTLNGNFSTFTNEVSDMGGAPDFTAGTRSQRVSEGRSVGAWEVTTPIDTNGDGLFDNFEAQFTGSTPYPLKTGGFSSDFILWNKLSFFASTDFAWDFEVFDAGTWWSWFNGLDRQEFPDRHDLDGNVVGQFNPTNARSILLVPGDYFKLRELSLRYELPESFKQNAGLMNANVFFTVRNALSWTRTDLLDPELSGVNAGGDNLQLGGAQSITLPAPRQFRLGVSFTF